jgi:hypothetical protein
MIFLYGVFNQSVTHRFQRVGNVSLVGRNNAVSASKVGKITAITKSRTKSGNRANLIGPNSHSNVGTFCRSQMV